MIQRKIFRFGVLAFVFLMPLLVHAQRGEKIQTIVIDAGHGGKDSGALGKTSMEKTLNLAVALKLGNYIKENLPDVKVVYTRDKDVFVELSERAAIANRNNADVFISIHCNSTEGTTTVSGAETFVMGESKNEANLNVAKKENAAILLEDNTDAYDHFDPNSTEAYIIFSLTQGLYQSQSLSLADKVQKQFADKVGRNNRGVQQAGFLVLWKTSMPSILVELGFINNVNEEKFLSSERGQTQMALALYQAFVEYKREFEDDNQQAISQAEVKPEIKPEEKPEAKVEQPIADTTQEEVFFSVQFASSKNKVPLKDPTFRKIKAPRWYKSKGMYCYSSGKFPTKAAAEVRMAELQKMGYEDAFIVAFIGRTRVSIKQAEAELRNRRKNEGGNQLAISQAKVKPEAQPEVKPELKPEVKPKKKVEKPISINENLKIFFSVLFASSKNDVPINTDPSLKKIQGAWKFKSKEMYCYASGKYASKADAEERQKELIDMGYGDAFVIAFIGDERVSVKQAEAELKKQKR